MAKSIKEANHFGDYLKFVREAKGLSLKEVEKATGIPNAYLSQLETGSRKKLPPPDRLRLLADFFNVRVQQFLEKAGYYEPEEIKETYEQSVEKGFLHAINDPRFRRGSHVKTDELTLDAKRFIYEIYAHNILLRDRANIIPATVVAPDGELTKTLQWMITDVLRDTFKSGDAIFVRYRVKVTCTEKEGRTIGKGLLAKMEKESERITQTSTGDGESSHRLSPSIGFETQILTEATEHAIKIALKKIKGTEWASLVGLK